MLTIRLQRLGKKKKPSYRLVVSEKTRDTQAKSLELLGHYSPTQDPKLFEVKADRIKQYIDNGAECSPTVHNLLVKEGVISGDKKKSVAISKKRQAKIDEKVEAEAAKKREAEEAAKAAAEEAKAAEEAAKAEAEAAKKREAEEKPEEAVPAAEKPAKEEAPTEEEKKSDDA